MTGRVLIVADPRDRLARAVSRLLPEALVRDAGADFPASFTVLPAGQARDGHFEPDAMGVAWTSVAAILVRPGTCWDLPARFGTAAEGLACHERRAAWCALLRAFPGRVVDRLSPAWFVDRGLHGHALALALAPLLATEATDAALDPEPTTTQAVYAVDGRVIPAGPGPAPRGSLAAWMRRRQPPLAAWQRDIGLRCVRVVGQRARQSWSLSRVDPAPSVAGARAETLHTLAAALAEALR